MAVVGEIRSKPWGRLPIGQVGQVANLPKNPGQVANLPHDTHPLGTPQLIPAFSADGKLSASTFFRNSASFWPGSISRTAASGLWELDVVLQPLAGIIAAQSGTRIHRRPVPREGALPIIGDSPSYSGRFIPTKSLGVFGGGGFGSSGNRLQEDLLDDEAACGELKPVVGPLLGVLDDLQPPADASPIIDRISMHAKWRK